MLVHMNMHHTWAFHAGFLSPVGMALPLAAAQPAFACFRKPTGSASSPPCLPSWALAPPRSHLAEHGTTTCHTARHIAQHKQSPQQPWAGPAPAPLVSHVPALWLPLPWPLYTAWWYPPADPQSNGSSFCSTAVNWHCKTEGLFNARLFWGAEHSHFPSAKNQTCCAMHCTLCSD